MDLQLGSTPASDGKEIMLSEIFYWIYWPGFMVSIIFYWYILASDKDDSYDDPGLVISAVFAAGFIGLLWPVALPALIWSWHTEKKQKY